MDILSDSERFGVFPTNRALGRSPAVGGEYWVRRRDTACRMHLPRPYGCFTEAMCCSSFANGMS